jgi:hypothetical protein
MKYSFKARIYKIGVNPCVRVPYRITDQLKATKGYIPVKGTIEDHFFQQTLCPVKGEGYRLYVNGPMLKGAHLTVGQTAHFIIGQDTMERNKNHPMAPDFKKKLVENDLIEIFEKLTPSRQKEINRYLNNLKTEESLKRNIDKLIKAFKGKAASILVPRKNSRNQNTATK